MSITWPGHVPRIRINALALNTDLAPTILRLIDLVPLERFEGFDWAGVLRGTEKPSTTRITLHQAHKGAVISNIGSEMARRSGLLEVGKISGAEKELFRIDTNRRHLFNLKKDPREGRDLSGTGDDPTGQLLGWMRLVYEQLIAFDDLPPEPLDEESVLQLKSLGYVD
jgi:arylsulfatase A-like enzyme